MGFGQFWKGVLEEGLKSTSKLGIPVLSNIAGIGSHLVDRAKDLELDMKFSGIATDIGGLKDGLNNVKADMEAQGKALQGAIDGVKSELEGQLKQQGDKLAEEIKQQDAKIANLEGKQRRQAEEQKKALQRQKEELESQIQDAINKFSQAQKKLKQELEDFKEEVNERFTHAERKIAENKRKLEEERIKREEEIKDANSKINLTQTNLENLREEKEELQNNFAKYQANINNQTADTQQAFADLETDYQHNKGVLDARIRTQEEILEEQEEDLAEFRQQQKQVRLEIHNITEDLETQTDLIFQQQRKLNLVSEQMEEIAQETHEKLNVVEGKIENVLSIAKKTTRQVNKLSEELETERKRVKELEQQIEKNKHELNQVREEAKITNERLDWLIEDRNLTLDSEIAFNKLQKSITLKADESKLLAQLNILNRTKDLLPEKEDETEEEREWKIGIQQGTQRDLDRPEGMPLKAGSYWEKIFGIEQLREWGWDVRIENKENETAPLTTPELRKPQKTKKAQTEKTKDKKQQELRKQIENTKEKLLAQLREIQQHINENLPEKEIFTEQATLLSTNEKELEEQLNIAYQKKQGQIPLETWENNEGLNQHIKDLEKQLEAISDTEDLTTNQSEIKQIQQELLTQQWEQIQQLQEEVFEEDLPFPKLPNVQPIQEKLEKIKEMEQALVASKKSMTKWMLFLIIFLLEYVVYKKNGILGLILLNVILTIAYYKKEAILQHYDLWEKYFLIIGYVIGNVLAYSVPEQDKYKWPSVIGFNAIVLGIYGYTYYQQKGIKQVINKLQEEILEENNIIKEEFQQAEKAQEEEYLAEQQKIIETLQEIVSNPIDSTVNIEKLESKWPGIKKEYTRVKEWFKSLISQPKNEKQLSSELTKILTNIKLDEDNKSLLLALNLSKRQFLALVKRIPQLKDIDITNDYSTLTNEQKLQLLELALKTLESNDLTSKKQLVKIRQLKTSEEKEFDLTVNEKEQLLNFFLDGLQLTTEQKKEFEKMGVSFVNANNWTISNEQKDNFLKLGLAKIQFSETEKQELFITPLSKYKISPTHKNIINSLSPLIKEFKYSSQLLVAIKELTLPNSTLNILISENIIPNLNTDFTKSTTPYLALKSYFLKQKQHQFQKEILAKQKELSRQKAEEARQNLLPTLLEYGIQNRGKLTYLKFRLDSEYFSDKQDWVNQGAIKAWQQPYFFLNGFYLIPKYHYFELLIFAGNLQGKSIDDYLPVELAEDWENYLTSLENKEDKGKQKEAISSFTSLTTTPTEEKPNPLEKFLTLSPEEMVREKKRKEREIKRKQLEETERLRREAKLQEKDKKLTDEQEWIRKEQELIAQEEQKQRQAEELRQQRLREEQERYLAEKLKQIEAKRKRAEESLAVKKKEAELEEQRKREQINRIKEENLQEQERLQKQAELIEEEKQKRLEAINLEDKEERQRIEKRANEEKARIKAEINEKRRVNEEQLKKKEAELLAQKGKEQVEIEKLEKEMEMQKTLGEELKQTGDLREALLKRQKNETQALEELRKRMYNACLDFYMNTQEIKKGTRYQGSHCPRSGCLHLKDLINDFPNMTFNLYFGDIYEDNWDGWAMAMKTFYKAVGNRFVNAEQLKQIINKEVHTLTYLDNQN